MKGRSTFHTLGRAYPKYPQDRQGHHTPPQDGQDYPTPLQDGASLPYTPVGWAGLPYTTKGWAGRRMGRVTLHPHRKGKAYLPSIHPDQSPIDLTVQPYPTLPTGLPITLISSGTKGRPPHYLVTQFPCRLEQGYVSSATCEVLRVPWGSASPTVQYSLSLSQSTPQSSVLGS